MVMIFFLISRTGGFKQVHHGFWAAGREDPDDRTSGFVQKVIDGDTIILRDGRRIRYLNVDCPERGEPFYRDALRFNQRLVDGQKVRLTFCPEKKKDRYGRWLAHVQCGETNAGRALLREGLAFLLLITPCNPEVEAVMVSDFKAARARKRGIWGGEDVFRVSPEEAFSKVGRHGIIEGFVAGSFSNDRLIFFDIGQRSADNFRLVVLSPYFPAFREGGVHLPEDYEKRKIKAWGKLADYKGRAQIFLF